MTTDQQEQSPLNGHGVMGVISVRGVNPLRLSHEQEIDDNIDRLDWDVDSTLRSNYQRVGRRLAQCPELFRNGDDRRGLILVLPSGQARLIATAADLTPLTSILRCPEDAGPDPTRAAFGTDAGIAIRLAAAGQD